MLDVTTVTKAFDGLVAVHRVDVRIRPGEIVGLIGPNGAGKTTLFNLISGACTPDEGRIVLDDEDITRYTPERRCKRGIARTFQLVRIFPELTVLQNVCVGRIYGRSGVRTLRQARIEAHEVLERVGLSDRGGIEARHLTLVDRKRLELARALATQPRLLLLDELLAGLNPSEVRAATDLIRGIRDRGIAVLMVEHIVSAVFSLADRVMCMAAGEKIAEGAPADIVADPVVIEAYLGEEPHG